ncbi:hypothetical protein [Chromobacterium alticapitis]|uniref:hypothetical protein n=1 Tax=Chromobacterium alticapitis TaxID=2073169 RepID=UPI001304B17E|nr:hypothetical protein [Chromobacterium alticapitis]
MVVQIRRRHVQQIIDIQRVQIADKAIRLEQRRLHHQIAGAGIAEVGGQHLALDPRQELAAVVLQVF